MDSSDTSDLSLLAYVAALGLGLLLILWLPRAADRDPGQTIRPESAKASSDAGGTGKPAAKPYAPRRRQPATVSSRP